MYNFENILKSFPIGREEGKAFGQTVNRMTFGGNQKASELLEACKSERVSIIEFLEKAYYGENPEKSPFYGKSHSDIIAMKKANHALMTAVEKLATEYGLSLKRDSYSKAFSIGAGNGAGNVLAPALILLSLEMAMAPNDVLSQIVGSSIGTDSHSVKKPKLTDSDLLMMKRTTPGAELPVIKYDLTAKTIDMEEVGGKLKVPTRILNEMVIGVNDIVFATLVENLNTAKTNEAIRVLIAGDGHSNDIGANQILAVATTNTVVAADWGKFKRFGKSQYFGQAPTYIGSYFGLSKIDALALGVATQSAYLDIAGSKMIQWDGGLLATGQANNDWVIKFNPQTALTEVYQNPGLFVTTSLDEDQNQVISFTYDNLFLKGHQESAVALNITL